MAKGQGLSVNMLIIIALGLAVLIISIMLVVKQNAKADATLSDTCTAIGGTCDSTKVDTEPNKGCAPGTEPVTLAACADETRICCRA